MRKMLRLFSGQDRAAKWHPLSMNNVDYIGTVALLLPSLLLSPFVATVCLRQLAWVSLVAVAAYGLCTWAIPRAKEYTRAAGLKGKDLGKRGTKLEDVEVYVTLNLAVRYDVSLAPNHSASSVESCIWQL